MTHRLSELSVFMPAYNEEANVSPAIEECISELPLLTEKYEIIIVDDGSDDRTAEIAQNWVGKNEHVRLIRHDRNRGFGAACRTGINASSYQYIFYTDIDGQFRIRDLTRLISFVENSHIVSGYRLHRADPPFRLFYAFCYNTLLKIIFGISYRDVDASFKIYHKEIFDYLKIESETGFSDAETLVKARYLGMTIKQVGVNHYPRRAGRVSFQLAQRGLFQGLVKFNAIRDLWNDLRSFYRRLSKGLYWKDRLNSVKIRKIGG